MHLRNSQQQEKSFHSSIEWQNLPREGCAVTAFQVDVNANMDTHSSKNKETLSAADIKTQRETETENETQKDAMNTLETHLFDAFSEVR